MNQNYIVQQNEWKKERLDKYYLLYYYFIFIIIIKGGGRGDNLKWFPTPERDSVLFLLFIYIIIPLFNIISYNYSRTFLLPYYDARSCTINHSSLVKKDHHPFNFFP